MKWEKNLLVAITSFGRILSPLVLNPCFLCYNSVDTSGKEKELQAELTKKRREFERVRNEKDAARLEVEYMKSKVKVRR